MKRTGLVVAALLGALALSACGAGNHEAAGPATATSTATAAATPPPTTQADVPGRPLDAKTGVDAVDRLLAAIASGDLARLRALVEPSLVPCVSQQAGIGGPPACPAGVPAATPVAVLPFFCPEARWVPVDQIDLPLRTLFEGSPRLYAVFYPDPNFFSPGDSFPVPDTYVALSHYNAPLGNQLAVHLVQLRAGRIVGLGLACTPGLKNRVPGGGFIVPPPG